LLVLPRAEEEDDHEEITFGRRGRGDCLDGIVGQQVLWFERPVGTTAG
jgi:hypothetical protein